MQPKEAALKIRRIRAITNRLANDFLAGEYHSVFKGRGMEFDESREYQPGDDIRTIDWNVTSRAGRLFVKRFIEERELAVMLLIDASDSTRFGSKEKTKAEVIAEIAAVIAFSAIKNNDRVGAIIFSDKAEKFIPPRRGSAHALHIIRESLVYESSGNGTCIEKALELLNRVVRKRSVIFLISDLFDQGYEKALKTANRKHSVVVIQTIDAGEKQLPNIGIIEIRDAETKELVEVDLSFASIRDYYQENFESSQSERLQFFKASRIDHVVIEADKPYDIPLVRFFARRARQIR